MKTKLIYFLKDVTKKFPKKVFNVQFFEGIKAEDLSAYEIMMRVATYGSFKSKDFETIKSNIEKLLKKEDTKDSQIVKK